MQGPLPGPGLEEKCSEKGAADPRRPPPQPTPCYLITLPNAVLTLKRLSFAHRCTALTRCVCKSLF